MKKQSLRKKRSLLRRISDKKQKGGKKKERKKLSRTGRRILAGLGIVCLALAGWLLMPVGKPVPEPAAIFASQGSEGLLPFTLTVGNNGGLYVAGGITSGGRFPEKEENAETGYRDAFVLKYSSGGERLWARRLSTRLWDEALGSTMDSAGNLYVAGRTHGQFEGQKHNGGYDYFLAKYDREGRLLWLRQGGSKADDVARSVTTDSKGNVYVSGSTTGSLYGSINMGGTDAFLRKYDRDGNLLWTVQRGTPYDDEVYSSALYDRDQSVFLAGTTGGPLDDNEHRGYQDIFILRYSHEGELMRSLQAGTPEPDHARSLALDRQGNAYVAGYTLGSFEEAGAETPFEKSFVIKFSGDGGRLWSKEFINVPAGRLTAQTLALSSSGYLYLGGFLSAPAGSVSEEGGTFADPFVYKLSPWGTVLWGHRVELGGEQTLFGLGTGPHRRVFAAGTTIGEKDRRTEMFLYALDDSFERGWGMRLGRLWRSMERKLGKRETIPHSEITP